MKIILPENLYLLSYCDQSLPLGRQISLLSLHKQLSYKGIGGMFVDAVHQSHLKYEYILLIDDLIK